MNLNQQTKLFKNLTIPNSFKYSLNDFASLSGCACLFLTFENKYVHSSDCKAESLMNGLLTQSGENLFETISRMKTSRDDHCIELEYNVNEMGVFIPVKLKGILYGYFVIGQFIEESNFSFEKNINSCDGNNSCVDKKSVIKLVSRKELEDNIRHSIRFVKGLEAQLDLSYELSDEINKNQEVANELRLQSAFFENLFENSPDAIVILDNLERIIKVNKEFENLFEYSQEEVHSKRINDLIVPDNFKEEGKTATKDVASGDYVDFTSIRQSKSGKQIHVNVTGKPIILDNNRLAVYASYRNITDQVWNQKSQNLLYNISNIFNQFHNTIDLIKKIELELKSIIGSGELFLDLISLNKRNLRHFKSGLDKFEEKEFSESISHCVLKKKCLQWLDETQISDLINRNQIKIKEVPKGWIGIPLITHDEVLGVFGIVMTKQFVTIDEKSIKLLLTVAQNLAAEIIEKKHRQELKMLHQAIEQSPASVVITDLKGDIEYVNPKFTNISGYTAQEVLGKNPRILKSGYTHQKVYKDLWRTISSGEEWEGEFLNVKKSKELYWEKAVFSAIKNEEGENVHYLAVKEDITKNKKYEKQLEEAKQKAEESDSLKSAFLANMSHELRTPLNAIIGFSNLCDDSLSVNEIVEFVQLINKSGNQLLGIIEDILSFTILEGEKLVVSKEEFLMKNFLKQVEDMTYEKRIIKNKERLELRFSPDKSYQQILVKTDSQKLMQVVTNLVKNALKFTNEGFVEIGYYVENQSLKIYVTDTGVGIDKAKKDIIFDKFRQVDDSITRTYGGTGIGLAISKKIMDLLGGSIEVKSEVNKGSTFILSLDCIISKKSGTIEKEQQLVKGDVDHLKILVAEDEISNYKLIQAILKRNGYQVYRAENGEEAIAFCKEHNDIDLILMDLRMPGIDGIEATKAIKEFKPDLPIIAQTAFAMNGDKDNAIANGCDDYISKPIKKELLLEKLNLYI